MSEALHTHTQSVRSAIPGLTISSEVAQFDAAGQEPVGGAQRAVGRYWQRFRRGVVDLATPNCLLSVLSGLALIFVIRTYEVGKVRDPGSVVMTMLADLSAGDGDSAASFLADDAVLLGLNEAHDRAHIRAWIGFEVPAEWRTEVRSLAIDGEKVTWQGKLSRSDWRRFGIRDPLTQNEAEVRDGKLTRWTSSWIDADHAAGFLPPDSLITPAELGSFLWLQAGAGLFALSAPLLRLAGWRGTSANAKSRSADQPGRLLIGLLLFAQNRSNPPRRQAAQRYGSGVDRPMHLGLEAMEFSLALSAATTSST